jgi:glutathione reductase (NADPH)
MHALMSTGFMELDELPRRIVFVGAGYISLEFAHLAHHAGAEVIVLGRGAPLPIFDDALVERLLDYSRDIGIDVRLDHSVSAVEHAAMTGTYRVHAGHGANMHMIETDLVVHGAGRVPNSARLCPAAGHIELEHHGSIRVNEFLQSVSNPRVYAAGDVVSPPGSIPLTPVAAYEGSVVAANLLNGNTTRPDFRGTASVVFTNPTLSCVGLTEKAARAKGFQVRVATADTTQWFTNRRVREPVGMFKTIIDTHTDRVLGAHILGGVGEEVINLFGMAIRFDIPAAELKKMLYSYPTGSSNMAYML